MIREEELWEALRRVVDPELACNIVDLGLVYEMVWRDGRVKVRMTTTSPGCPLEGVLVAGVRQALLSVPGVAGVEVELVYDPPWHPGRIHPAAWAASGGEG